MKRKLTSEELCAAKLQSYPIYLINRRHLLFIGWKQVDKMLEFAWAISECQRKTAPLLERYLVNDSVWKFLKTLVWTAWSRTQDNMKLVEVVLELSLSWSFNFALLQIYWKKKHRKRTRTFFQNLLFNSFPIKSYFWTSCVYRRKSPHPSTNKEANNRLNCLELSSDWFSYTSVFYRNTEKLNFEVPLSKSNSQTFPYQLSFDSAPFRFYRTSDSKTHNHLAQFVS